VIVDGRQKRNGVGVIAAAEGAHGADDGQAEFAGDCSVGAVVGCGVMRDGSFQRICRGVLAGAGEGQGNVQIVEG
jgi:hypothetical protein